MSADFTHLHVHTDASLLDGGNPVSRLIGRAKDLGQKSLAITDHGVLFNIWNFQQQAKKAGIKPILGMEAYIAPGHRGDRTVKTPGDKWYSHLVILAQNETGYKNLIKLSSRGFTEGFYYNPRIDREILEEHSEGLIVSSACLAGELAQAIEYGTEDQARDVIRWYKKVFGDRYYVEVQAHRSEGQAALNAAVLRLGTEEGVKAIATTDAHFLTKGAHKAHDCLICIGMKKTLDDPSRLHYDEGLYMQSGDEVAQFFPNQQALLDNTMEIADRVKLGFEKRYHVPSFPVAAVESARLDAAVSSQGGQTGVLSSKVRDDVALSATDLEQRAREVVLLRELTEVGALVRYGNPLPPEILERMEYELKVISDAGYAGYHLIVQDFIRAARAEGIPVGPGRGSAAGSLVCYSLGITNIDPIRFDLLFERFLNPDRISMPDIDVDFCFEGRARVIEYVKEKYGREAVCQIVTFGTLQARAVVKDVGRVLGFTPKEVDDFAKMIPNAPNYSLTVAEAVEKIPEIARLVSTEPRYQQLVSFATQLEGLRRSSGVHAAGVVIAPGPVTDFVPVARAKDDQLVTQYDMNDLEQAGMLKMDFLGLKTLTVLNDALKMIEKKGLVAPDLDTLSLDDAATYEMLAKGNVAGVFQFESALAREKLTAMKPDNIEDLIATNALLRPGPLETGMTDAFIRRKRGEEKVTYPHPLLEPVLKNTQGVITYQEQIMRAVQVLAGYTLAEADVLRKAVGKKDAIMIANELGSFEQRAVATGTCTATQANDIARLIETFGRYGFNRSHSAAYSVLGYHTAYLKRHFPAQFMAALLSSYRDDTETTIGYLREAKDMGAAVLPPHVNESESKFGVVTDANGVDRIRFGMSAIKGVGEGVVGTILGARQQGQFADFFDFVHRVGEVGKLSSNILVALIHAGALDGLAPSRAAMLALIESEALKKAQERAKKWKVKVADAAALAAAPPVVTDGSGDLFGGQPSVPKKRASKPLERPAGVDEYGKVVLDYPAVAELDPIERLAREREVIGLYVSGHPMDGEAEAAAALRSHSMAELQTWKPGTVRAIGVITEVKEWTSKGKNTKNIKVQIEDPTGSLSAIAFSKQVEKFGFLLKPGKIVCLEGTFNEADQHLDRVPDLRVDSVQLLSDALQAGEVAVSITLSPETRNNPTSMERVRAILEENEGNAQVIIVETGKKPREARSRVRPSSELLDELRDELGAQQVTLSRGKSAYDAKENEGGRFRGR